MPTKIANQWNTTPGPRPQIRAAHTRATNADMIADVAKLYLTPDDHVVDITYGLGKFWTKHRPANLTAHDIDPAKGDGIAWSDLPEESGSVDVVVFDPPYMPPGGRATSTIGAMNDRYGMHTTAATPRAQWDCIKDGIDEAARILKSGGDLWLKSMNYIMGGRYINTLAWAFEYLEIDFDIIDLFVYVGGTGPQPTVNRDGTPRRQQHARNNYSTLIIARRQ